MNKIYRAVWNENKQTWVAASELAKGRVKSNLTIAPKDIKRKNRWWGLMKLAFIAGLIQLQFCTSLSFASNIALIGSNSNSTTEVGTSFDNGTGYGHGSHGSVVLAGDDDQCGADKVQGRRGLTSGMTALAQYLRFANNTTLSGKYHPYGTSQDVQKWSGSGMTTSADATDKTYVGYTGPSTTGGEANALPDAYGVYSFAYGCGSYTEGNYSVAFGSNATALGGGAMAFGVSALASSPASIAFGDDSEATGTSAVAVGSIANAQGEGSVAMGLNAQAVGADADIPMAPDASKDPAAGKNLDSMNPFASESTIAHSATAIGNSALANGSSATAVGNVAQATGTSTVAVGYAAKATAVGGVALGGKSVAATEAGVKGYDAATGVATQLSDAAWSSTAGAVSVGDADHNITRQINGVAAGLADTDAVNVAQLKGLHDSVSSGISNLSGRSNDLQTGLDDANQNISTLQTGLSDTNSNISTVQTHLDSTNDAVSGLQTDLSNATDNISTLQTSLDTTNNTISGLQTDLTTANSNIDTLHKNLASTDQNVSQLQTHLSDTDQTMTELQGHVTDTQTDVGHLQHNALQWDEEAGAYDAGRLADADAETKTAAKIINVADGSLSQDSTEAVNGGQLFTTNSHVSSLSTTVATGLDGLNTAINTTQTDLVALSSSTADSIGQLSAQLDTSVSTVNSHLTDTDAHVSAVQQNALQWDDDLKAYDASHGSADGQKITHVAAGRVAADSSDAINGSQLFTTNSHVSSLSTSVDQQIAGVHQDVASLSTTAADGFNQLSTSMDKQFADVNQNLSSLSTSADAHFKDLTDSISTITSDGLNQVSTDVSTLQNNALQWNDDLKAYDASHGSADGQKITHVAAGSVAADSSDVVNGSQLYDLSTSTVSHINTLTSNIQDLSNGLNQTTDQLNILSTATASSLSSVNSSLSRADHRLDSLSTSASTGLNGLSKDLTTTNSNLTSLSSSTVDQLHQLSTTTAGSISTLNQDLTSTGQQLTQLSTTTATSLSTLTGDLSEANVNISGLQQNALQWNQDLGAYDAAHNSTRQKITHVAAGDVAVDSADAVNGSQLYQTNTDVAQLSTAVDKQFANVNQGLSSLSTSTDAHLKDLTDSISTITSDGLNQVSGNVDHLQQNSLQWNNDLKAYDAAHGSTDGQKITHVAAGSVAADSSDAVNGSQLYDLTASTDRGFNSLSTSLSQTDTDVGNLSKSLGTTVAHVAQLSDSVSTGLSEVHSNLAATDANVTGLQQNALQWNDDLKAYDVARSSINQKITHVAAGDVAADSSDAVNGSQLYDLTTDTANHFTDVEDNLSTTNTVLTHLSSSTSADVSSLSTSINSVNSSLIDTNTQLQLTNTNLQHVTDDLSTTNSQLSNVTQWTASQLQTTNSHLTDLSTSTAGSINQLNAGLNDANSQLTSLSTQTSSGLSSLSHDLANTHQQLDGLQQNSLQWNSQQGAYDAAGADGSARQITHVAEGRVEKGSTDAINGEQFYDLSTSTSAGLNSLSTGLSSMSHDLLSTTNDDYDSLSASLNDADADIADLQSHSLQWRDDVGGYDASHNDQNQKITHVAAGDVSDASTDAINGAQLNTLATATDHRFNELSGGLSQTNDTVNSVTRSLGDTITRVAELTDTTSTGIHDLSTQVAATQDNVALLQQNSLQWDDSSQVYDAAHAGTTAKITHVAAGDVAADSTDAVNGSQLYDLTTVTQDNIHSLSTGLSHTLTDLTTTNSQLNQLSTTTGNSISTLNQDLLTSNTHIAALEQNTLQWNQDTHAYDAAHGTSQPQRITRVAAGEVSDTSTDAINGAQLQATNEAIQQLSGILGTSAADAGETGTSKPVYTTTNAQGETLTANTVNKALNNLYQGGLQSIHVNNSGNDSIATGKDAIAIGDGAKASGDQSFSIGTGNVVTGNHSGAIGDPNTIHGTATYALGNNNNTGTADHSMVLGSENSISNSADNPVSGDLVVGNNAKVVNASNSMIVGNNAYMAADNGLALGNQTAVTGIAGIAAGQNASVLADNGIALGTNAQAANTASVALGFAAKTTVDDGVALGSESVANTAAGAIGLGAPQQKDISLSAAWQSTRGAVSVGDMNQDITRQITGVAAGTEDTDAVNVAQLKAFTSDLSTSLNDTLANSISTGLNGLQTDLSTVNTSLVDLQQQALQLNGKDYDARNHIIGNVADGRLAADSHDAVNGSQLASVRDALQADINKTNERIDYLADIPSVPPEELTSLSTSTAASLDATHNALATGLGGGAAYDDQGQFIAPQYTTTAADGSSLTAHNVADGLHNLYQGGSQAMHVNSRQDSVAKGKDAVAIGSQAQANGDFSIAMGSHASTASQAHDAIAIGTNTSATQNGGVALGSGSVASVAAGVSGYVPAGATDAQMSTIDATRSTQAAVAVGNADGGTYRQITGVAAGTNDSDAVNVAQLKAVNNQMTQINQYVNNIDNRIDHVERKAYSGTALALALSGAYLPALNGGEQAVGVGVGSYQGYAAVGVNYKALNNHGDVSWGAGISSTGHEFGLNAGLGFKW
ncbi:ESPR-type extended signal peptide-containing protein [Neisseriaceae bacterium ESL0693]|nr:ESPR-type extended signal peptide-containing protein [Neisseriaceae bacterium ESL0693]